MASVDSVSSLNQSISSRADEDKKQLLQLGGDLEKAEKNFQKIANDPNANPGQLEAAKVDFERQSERFKAKVAIMDSVIRLFNGSVRSGGDGPYSKVFCARRVCTLPLL